MDVLLKKWDVKRNIQRDQVYKKLSLKRKEDLLSQIALNTFEQGKYFFKQKEVERYITQYIQNLPDASSDLEILQLDSEAVLKSIEAQHGLFVERARGIYSFSHLTFHEYFTARKLVSSINSGTLQSLATHVTEKHWREIFLLTVGMLDSADQLLQLMQEKINTILEGNKKLQQFLVWIEEKSKSVEASCKPAVVRAFYLTLGRDFNLALGLARSLDRELTLNRSRDPDFILNPNLNFDLLLAIDRDFNLTLNQNLNLDRLLAFDRDLALNLLLTLALDLAQEQNPQLGRALQQLQNQVPDSKNYEAYKRWWQENSQVWAEQLKNIMIEHRNIGYDWQFSDEQKDLLKQYYDANKLLVDCLNSDCYVSREVRQKIEDTLLLPILTSDNRTTRDSSQ